ncbi:EAL domain-containing protein [Photobacterium leiognathi]|uniref:EAL domain-containing protein n=1 Tax=Photobacterium leiognathi TaxID=553611 RepID=UPI0027331AB7|nr:EAL domain-containing protein [Photobacterium leiognathi]
MNIKYMKPCALAACSALFLVFFATSSTLLYKHFIAKKVRTEHQIQRRMFDSVVNSREELIVNFSKMTLPTLTEQRALKRYVSDNKDVSSVSVIYKDNYVYSTFGNRMYSIKKAAKEGFSIKMKSLLTHKPTVSYTVQVSPETYLKVYFKPFRFNVVDNIGYGYITLFDVVEIGDNNKLLRNSLLSNRKEHQFTLDDAEFFVEINPTLAVKEFVASRYVYLLLFFIVGITCTFLLSAYIKKCWVARCIQNNIVQPYLQPIVDEQGNIIGAEVLARWITKKGEIVAPYLFIPYIEKTKLTPLLTLSLMKQVYQSPLMLLSQGLKLSFNLTERCLFDPNIYKASLQLAPHCKLILEFTESAPFSHSDVVERMAQYHQHDVYFALDDYGTGYSAPHYLTDYQFDYFKIDRCFIDQIEHNPKSIHVVECLVLLAQKLQLTVISEGVETLKQKQMLEQWGIKQYQGFYFYKPMSVKSFMDIYRPQ